MASATNPPGYGNPGVAGSPWGSGPNWNGPGWNGASWNGPGWTYWRAHRGHGPMWIAAMILGFIFWWPVGLILLFWGIGGRRMSCWSYGRQDGYAGGWQNDAPPPPWVGWKRHWKRQMREWSRSQAMGQPGGQESAPPPSSGNRAFDEYRAETLRRLEEEQREFSSFLERLRFAKDKSEFDQFMTELRQRPPAPPSDQPA
jgi:hypothetical protein